MTYRLKALSLVGIVSVLASCPNRGVKDNTDVAGWSKALLASVVVNNASQPGLMDRNTQTGVALSSSATVDVVALKPVMPAMVHLYVTGPATLSTGGLPVDQATAGWVVLPAPGGLSERVRVQVTPVGQPVSVTEVELWAAGGTTAWRPLRTMVETAQDADPGVVAMRTEPDHGHLFPAETSDANGAAPTCMDVVFELNTTGIARAALTYEATGLAGSFSLMRSVNGLGQVGGYALRTSNTNMVRYVEHISAAHLVPGINRIHLCGPQAGTQSIRLQSMSVVAESERNVAPFSAVDPALDGEPSTTISLGRHDVRLAQPSKVEAVFVQHGGSARFTVELDGIAAGVREVVTGANGSLLWLDSPAQVATASIIASGVSVSEVHWLGSPVGAVVPQLVFNHPQQAEYFGTQGVITGFVAGPVMSAPALVTVSGEHVGPEPLTVATVHNAFGVLINRATVGEDSWWVDVTVTLPNGTQLTQRVDFLVDAYVAASSNNGRPTSNNPERERAQFGLEGDSAEGTVTPAGGGEVVLGESVKVQVPAHAVDTDVTVKVKRPSRHHLQALNPGMVNVTAPRGALYEFLPHGQRFLQPVSVTLPYDPTLIPRGLTPTDVRTYYYDTSARQYVALERVQVDVDTATVVSLTDHFTDMVNAVLVEPESPQPALFNPNQVASLAAADPTANMTLMAPPAPNKDGTASLSYPFTLPKARGAYQPQLSLSYSSEGGWGLAGEGWNTSVSSVEVDARFGAPRYEKHERHHVPLPGPVVPERYLLDGQQLVPVEGAATCPGGETAQLFRLRKEGSFQRIVRCGQDDADYHWEVTDKAGTRMIYGVSLEGRESDPTSRWATAVGDTCGNTERNIGRWLLERVVDVHGNETKFNYVVREKRNRLFDTTRCCSDQLPNENDDHCDMGRFETPWVSRVLDSIDYTSGNGLEAGYRVELIYTRRDDVNTSARLGFKVVKDLLLTGVKVRCMGACVPSGQLIREYALVHQAPVKTERRDGGGYTGNLFKTLLMRVDSCDALGCGFNASTVDGGDRHEKHSTTFEYEQPIPEMAAAETWLLPDLDLWPLQTSINAGLNAQAGVGINLASAGRQRGAIGVSGNVNGNIGTGQTVSMLIDINGDGLPDHFNLPPGADMAKHVVEAVAARVGVGLPDGGSPVAFNLGRHGDGGMFAIIAAPNTHPRDPALRGTDKLPPVLGLDLSGGAGVGGGYNVGIEALGTTGNVSASANVSGSLVFPTDINGDGLTDFAGPIPLFQHRSNAGVVSFLPGNQSAQDCVPFATDVEGGFDGGATTDGGEKVPTLQTAIPELVKRISEGSSKRDVVWRWRAPKAGAITVEVVASPLVECDKLTSGPDFKPPKLEVLILPRTLLPTPGDLAGATELLTDLIPAGVDDVLAGDGDPLKQLARNAKNALVGSLAATVSALTDGAPAPDAAPMVMERMKELTGPFGAVYTANVAPGAEVYVRVASGDSCINELAGGALDTVNTDITIMYNQPAGTLAPFKADGSNDVFDARKDFRAVGATPYVFEQDGHVRLLSGRVAKLPGATLADYVDVSLVRISCMPPSPGSLKDKILPGSADGGFFPASGAPNISEDFKPSAFFGNVNGSQQQVLKDQLRTLKEKFEAVFNDFLCTRVRYDVTGSGRQNSTLVEDHIQEEAGMLHEIAAGAVDFPVQQGDTLIVLVKGRTPIDPDTIDVTRFTMEVTPTEGPSFTADIPVQVTWRRLTTANGIYRTASLTAGDHDVAFNSYLWPGIWESVRQGLTDDEALPHLVIQTPGKVIQRVALKPDNPFEALCGTLLNPWQPQPDKPCPDSRGNYCATTGQTALKCHLIPCLPEVNVATACPQPFQDMCTSDGFGVCSVIPAPCTRDDNCPGVATGGNNQECIAVGTGQHYCNGAPFNSCSSDKDCLPTVSCIERMKHECEVTHSACDSGCDFGVCWNTCPKSQTCDTFKLTDVLCAPPGCNNIGNCGGSGPPICDVPLNICPTISAPCLPLTDAEDSCNRLFKHLVTNLGCPIDDCRDYAGGPLGVPVPAFPLLVRTSFHLDEASDVFFTIEPPDQALLAVLPEIWDTPELFKHMARWLIDNDPDVDPPPPLPRVQYPFERWFLSQAYMATTLPLVTTINVSGIVNEPSAKNVAYNILYPEGSFGLPVPIQVLSWWGVPMSEGYRGWGYGEWQRKLELLPNGAANANDEDRLGIPILGRMAPNSFTDSHTRIRDRFSTLRLPTSPPALGATPIRDAVNLVASAPVLLGDILPDPADIGRFLDVKGGAEPRMRAFTKLLQPPDFMPRYKIMHADKDRYTGTCAGAYVAAGISQPGRCAASSPIEIPGLRLPAPPLADIREKVQQLMACPTGAPRVSASLSATQGGTLTIIGASATSSLSTGITDYRDLTGDGIPDTVILTPLGLMVLRTEHGAPHRLPFVPMLFFGEMQRLSFSASTSPQKGSFPGHEGIPFYPSPGMSLSLNGDAVSLIDMNGDGLPDLVTTLNPLCAGVSVRLNLGTRFSDPPDCWSNYASVFPLPTDDTPDFLTFGPKAMNVGASLNLDVQFPLGLSMINPRLNSGHAGVSVTAAVQFDELSDVNGDGLPDRVFSLAGGTMLVQVNNGQGFEQPIPWVIGSKEHALQALGMSPPKFIEVNAEGNIELALPNGRSRVLSPPSGMQTGNAARLAKTILQRIYTLRTSNEAADVNDKLLHGMSTLGDQLMPHTLNASLTIGASAGGGIEVAPRVQIAEVGASIPINVGGGGNVSITFTDTMFMDIDGDGLPEPIQRVGYLVNGAPRAAILVHTNKVGTGNRLKAVTNPLGGRMELTYERVGNTYDMPSSKYVLTGIVQHSGAFNGVPSGELPFGTDTPTRFSDVAQRISYKDGRHDRLNKEFLGFGKVIVEELDGPGGAGLRTTCQEYHNTQYETAGQLARAVRAVGGGEEACALDVNKLDEEIHEYHPLRTVADNPNDPQQCFTPAPMPAAGCTSTASFPLSIRKRSYEGGVVATETLEEFTLYDEFGNVTIHKDFQDVYDPTRTDDDLWATTTFQAPDPVNYLPSLPIRYVVGELSSGRVLRARAATYTPEGLLQDFIAYDGAGHQLTTTRTWDGFGNLHSVTSPTGFTKVVTWDSNAHTYPAVVETRLKGETGPLDQRATRTFDARFGAILTETDANGGVMQFGYDGRGRMEKVAAPGGTLAAPDIAMEYACTGVTVACAHTVHSKPPGAEVAPETFQGADGLGKPLWTAKTAIVRGAPKLAVAKLALKDGLGRPHVAGLLTTVAARTALAGLLAAGVPLRTPTVTNVDFKDRPSNIMEPDSVGSIGPRTTTKTYLAAAGSLRVETLDAHGNKSAAFQDASGNTVAVEEYGEGPNGPATTTRYTFNGINELTRVINAAGKETLIEYDGLGRQHRIRMPDTPADKWHVTFDYDEQGRLKTKTDARGLVVTNEYEPGSSRVVAIWRTGEEGCKYPAPDVTGQLPPPLPQPPERQCPYTFVYGHQGQATEKKAVGRILLATDEDGADVFGYDALGNQVSIERTLRSGAGRRYATSFSYDSFGRVKSISYPDNEEVLYTYDGAGLVTAASNGTFTYVRKILYDEFGQRRSVEYGNTTTEAFAVDENTRRVTGIAADNSVGAIQNLIIGYDKVSNITSINEVLTGARAAAELPVGLARTLTYDALYRMTGDDTTVTTTEGIFKHYTSTFTFDNVHRMLTQHQDVDDQDGVIASESHHWRYRYRTDRPFVLDGIDGDAAGAFAYAHDEAGNMTHSAQGADVRDTTWTADGFQRGFTRTHPDANGAPTTTTTEYLYDSGAQRRAKTVNGKVTHYLGPHVTVDELGMSKHVFVGQQRAATTLSEVSGATQPYTLFYHTDHLNTTTALTDATGNLKERVYLYAYGGVFKDVAIGDAPVLAQRFLWTAKTWDPESGDSYFGWRYEAPDIARWRSAEPFWEDQRKQGPVGGNPFHVDRWRPVVFKDEDGRITPPPIKTKEPANSCSGVGGLGNCLRIADGESLPVPRGGPTTPAPGPSTSAAGPSVAAAVEGSGAGDAVIAGVVGAAAAAGTYSALMKEDEPTPTFFRGGESLTPRPGEFRNRLGVIPRGVSLFSNPEKAQRHGQAHRVENLPDSLTIDQRGKDKEHFEILPKDPTMTEAQYIEALKEVRLVPVGPPSPTDEKK